MKDRNLGMKLGIFSLSIIAMLSGITSKYFSRLVKAQGVPTIDILPETIRETNIYQHYQLATVRVVKATSAGSGVIIKKEGNIYSVLTNWHVIDDNSYPLILTADDRQHQLINPPKQVGDADLALLQFYSEVEYPTAKIATQMPQIGETVYAAGFPLVLDDGENSLKLGNEAFRLTQGEVSIVPKKSLPQGYRLGYTNKTAIGMSGSPIFNTEGLLVGIHGRGKYRDPGFGVYLFEDGSEPSPEQLKKMIRSSWGIPISIYSDYQLQGIQNQE